MVISRSDKKLQLGLTITETLIVMTIIAILLIIAFTRWKVQILRGHDAQRKADVRLIVQAFEEYFNDNGCYPPSGFMDDPADCGGPLLSPYVEALPCDPATNTPYLYIPNADPCTGYKLFAQIGDTSDLDIVNVGCAPTHCGYDPGYNWGMAVNASLAPEGFDPGLTPTPTPPWPPGQYACTPGGACNIYADPEAAGCPVTFADPQCNMQCGVPENRCAI